MAFFDKLNQVAKNIGDKTSDAIETTRLNSKIAAEKLAANEELLKIASAAPVGGITCPGCGASLPAGTKFCSGCGSKIEAAPAPQNQNVFCTGCGTQLPAGTKFCNSCGQRLDG